MKTSVMKLVLTGLIAGSMLSSPVFAQAPGAIPNDPGHPRVNEVDQRLNNQQNRIEHGEAGGRINPREARRDERRDRRVERQEHRDMRRNGGHLTRGEKRHLNRELNHNGGHIHNQRHPNAPRRR